MLKSLTLLLLGLVISDAPRVQTSQCQIPLVEDQLPDDVRKACIQKIVAAVAPPQNASGGPLTADDIRNGPPAKITFSERDVVYCRYYFKEQGGGSTKFRCYRTDADNHLLNKDGEVVARAVSVGPPGSANDEKLLDSAGHAIRNAAGDDEEADEIKVRYSGGDERNRENHTSVAAGRILWALGIATERFYPTRQVTCFGCGKDPFTQRQPAVDSARKQSQNTFPFATIEKKFDGEKIGEASQSWKWDELASLYPTLTESRQLEFEALLLASNLVHVVSYTGEQHSLRCGEKAKKGEPCLLPVAVVHDVGAAFGNRDRSKGVAPRGDFAAWDKVTIFTNPQICQLTLEASPEWNRISEKGRVAFLKRLKNLPKENVRAAFETAQFNMIDSTLRNSARALLVRNGNAAPSPNDISKQVIAMWTDEFMSKVAEIENATCHEVPQFSTPRGFYDAPFLLSITTPSPDATIRYTTNGNAPTADSAFKYNGPINISSTTVVRAATFVKGQKPSPVETHSYIFPADVIRQSPDGRPPPDWPARWGRNAVDYGMDSSIVNAAAYRHTISEDLKSIPSLSIVMNLKDLFDSTTGIYANALQDGVEWERPTSLELINPDGAQGFHINAGIRIRGASSRSVQNPKHSFRFFFREQYGADELKFPLFGDNGADTFDAIDLRTAQNHSWSFRGDTTGSFLNDQFSRDLQLAMGHPAERGNFYHLFINGQYWGLFNTAERPEASYASNYFGGSKDSYDVIKQSDAYTIEATDGDLKAWRRLWQRAANGFASDSAYFSVQGLNVDGTPNAKLENLLDVDNLIDYMLVILYGGNRDAPISEFLGNDSTNNWYGVRDRTGAHGGFRFFIHDAEHTLLDVKSDRTGIVDGKFGEIDEDWTAGNPLTHDGGSESAFVTSNPQYIWFRLQQNAEFRLRVADHVQRHFFNGGLLTPEGARELFLARKKQIDRAVVLESARWGNAQRDTALTRNNWIRAVNTVLEKFLPQRSSNVLNQLRADGLYPNVAAPSFTRRGGEADSALAITISASAGRIYYTRDGSDPRLRGGGIAPAASEYAGPITVRVGDRLAARVLRGKDWSALGMGSPGDAALRFGIK